MTLLRSLHRRAPFERTRKPWIVRAAYLVCAATAFGASLAVEDPVVIACWSVTVAVAVVGATIATYREMCSP